MTVITTTDLEGVTQVAVDPEPRELQVLRSPKPGGKT